MHIHLVPESAVFQFLCQAEYDATALLLGNCDMAEAAQREDGARALAASHIKRLKIFECETAFTAALLQNLGRNSRLKSLQLDAASWTSDLGDDIMQFLQETKTLQRFTLTWREPPQSATSRLLRGAIAMLQRIRLGWLLEPYDSLGATKQLLLGAIKRNFS